MNQIVQPDGATEAVSPAELKKRRKASDASIIKMIPMLVEAFQWRVDDQLREVSQKLVDATEESYPSVHRSLARLLRQTMSRPTALPRKAPDNLVALEQPRLLLEKVVLSPAVERQVLDIIAENHRQEELAAFDLAPRHRVLLHGEPGNGKTMLAEALAGELGVPFLRVKYSGLVASHLGETGKNVEAIFDYAASGPCVVFLDEFDGVGIKRDQAGDVTEMRRVTNQLLISLDRLPAHCMFIAATNSVHLVDEALLRRFDFKVEIAAPDTERCLRIAQMELATERTPGKDVTHLADQIAQLGLKSLNEVVNLCRQIRRDLVLNDGAGVGAIVQSAPQA